MASRAWVFLLFGALVGPSVVSGAAAPGYVWKSVAVGGGGYVTDVYCHPRERDLVFIRTDVGGFYRWDPAGKRWIPLTDRFGPDQANFYGGEGLALDPTDPNVVYIAAGKYLWRGEGGLFRSGDRGGTWTRLPLKVGMQGNGEHRWGGPRLVVSPFHPRVLLFGSRADGLWRSADAGASWRKVDGFAATLKPEIGITALAFDARAAGSVYAAAYGDGVYRSADDGLTWSRSPGGPAEVERLCSATDGALLATHAHGVARLAGGAWRDITPPGADFGFCGLSADPRDPRHLVAAGSTNSLKLYRSHDAGSSWTLCRYTVDSSVPWHSGSMKQVQQTAGLALDPCVPGRLWLTDWYATYVAPDGNADPVKLASHERGHEEVVVFSLAAPNASPRLVSGTADVDGFLHDDLAAFPRGLGAYYGGDGPAFGDTTQIAWCAGSPLHLARVGSRRWNSTGAVVTSPDGGRTWQQAPGWDEHHMPSRIAVAADDPANMVALCFNAPHTVVTTDGGKTWRDVAGLPGGPVPGNTWDWRFPLAADGAAPGAFYFCSGGTLYRSGDRGLTFQAGATGLPGSVSALVNVPGHAGHLWAVCGDAGLRHSGDGGHTFTALPAVRRAALFAVGRAAPGARYPTLYLYGTLADGRSGIFRSTSAGATWTDITDPRQPVGDDPNSMGASMATFGLVFVGTNGRGIFYGVPR